MNKMLLSIALTTAMLYMPPAISQFDVNSTIKTSFNKRALTVSTREALVDDSTLAKTLALLKKHPVGISIHEVVENIQQPGVKNQVLNTLQSMGTNKCFQNSAAAATPACSQARQSGRIEIPELWLFEPDSITFNYSINDVLFAYPPEGDEKNWTHIEAFDRMGNIVVLDVNGEPNVPVIVVETHGSSAFSHKVKTMNKMLQSSGLQSSTALRPAAAQPVQTTMMKKVHLRDDKEPWVKGAAEIYIITSGVKNRRNGPATKENEPDVRITALHYLNYAGTTYTPNQLVLFWDEHVYTAANIQFWEDDSGHNYQQLVSVLVKAVGQAGGLAGLPELTAVTNLAGMIIDAMPTSWFKDDDDFVDTCYTIVKGRTYNNHRCAANNATVSLAPFVLQPN